MPAPRLGTRSLALFLSFSRLFSPSLTLSPPLSLFSLFFFLLLSPPLPHTLAASLRSHVPPRLLLRYENQQMNIQQQSFNMEQQNYAISSLQDTKATVEAMKGAAKQMKKEMKTINIDNVEDLQMEMEDLLEDSNEIQEVRDAHMCPGPAETRCTHTPSLPACSSTVRAMWLWTAHPNLRRSFGGLPLHRALLLLLFSSGVPLLCALPSYAPRCMDLLGGGGRLSLLR